MKGYDGFFDPPGTVVKRSCQVCGTECEVERNRIGPTGWTEAVAKLETVCDFFYCPNTGKPWHDQALALVQAIESTPSKRIAALMQQDLIDLLSENGRDLRIASA